MTATLPLAGRRLAITGATGFLGHHLASQARAAGAEVVALARRPAACARLLALGCTTARADLEDPDALARGCGGCDVLLHLAGAVDFHEDWNRFYRANV